MRIDEALAAKLLIGCLGGSAIAAFFGTVVGAWILVSRRYEIYSNDINEPVRGRKALGVIVTINQEGRDLALNANLALKLSWCLITVSVEYWIFSRNYSDILRRKIKLGGLTPEEVSEINKADTEFTAFRSWLRICFTEALLLGIKSLPLLVEAWVLTKIVSENLRKNRENKLAIKLEASNNKIIADALNAKSKEESLSQKEFLKNGFQFGHST